MSYHCGIEPNLAALMGVEPGGPRITCDGCGVRITIRDDRMPPKWLLDGRAAPKWRMTKHDDGTRTDLCPKCKETT